jgi:hypothetical protein
MPSSINASTTAGVVTTADTSGVLNIQTAGVTAISIDASQAVSFTNSPTVTGGTANGVPYLNGSKMLTTGSALVFDGANLGVGVTPNTFSTGKAIEVGFSGNSINGFESGSLAITSGTYYNNNWYRANALTSGYMQYYRGELRWYVGSAGTAGTTYTPSQIMTLDASGNLAIGSTSANARLHVYGANTASAYAQTALIQENIYPNSAFPSMAFQTWAGGNAYKSAVGGNGTDLCFYTSSTYGVDPTERARIDGGGSLLVGRTSALSSEKFGVTQSAANLVAYWTNSNATTPSGLYMNYSAASPNNTGSNFIQVGDSSANRFIVNSNGGIQNYSANNVNLSDQREKKNIELAGNYLDKICAIPIKTFLFNDQTDTDKNLGAIAQDVQAVAPELVMESDWGTKEEPKIRLSIYQTDLQYALMKCIQEMKTIIDEQAQRISVLEAK